MKKFPFRLSPLFMEGFALGCGIVIFCFFFGKFLIRGPVGGFGDFLEGFISGLSIVLVVYLIIRRVISIKRKNHDKTSE
jgi:hypothetical protein